MKRFLLSLVLLAAPAYAVNWEMIDTDVPNFSLYVDDDSFMYANNDECYYAIRYKEGDKPQKIAYLKSNTKTNYIGVIQTGDYETDVYKPQIVFRNAHVFMKPVKENSFLNHVHQYAVTMRKDCENIAQKTPILRENNIKPISVTLKNDLKTYTAQTALLLNKNWNPPTSWQSSQAEITVIIGVDGSLQNYRFTKSSGNETVDRSIVSAVERSVPFAKFPRQASDIEPTSFKFTFDYTLFKKSVK